MQNAQPTTNCAKWIFEVDYLSISKQQKKFGVSKMQGYGTGNPTIAHLASRRRPETRSKKLLEIGYSKVWCFKYYFISPHIAIYITVCDDLR